MTAEPFQAPLARSGPVSVAVRVRGTTTLIELEGEWDLAGTPAVRQAVARVLRDDPKCVVLDLAGLSFIDSSGLEATVDLVTRCDAQGVRVVIIPGPRAVQRVFQLCGLIERLPFTDARGAAGRLPGKAVPSLDAG